MKILFVDNNPDTLFIHELAQSYSHKVAVAPNGIKALEMAKDFRPDIVVSDIFIPEMDGFTLCKLWNDDKKLREIPFAFYTDFLPEKDDEQFTRKLGVAHFLIKSQNPEKFLSEIKEIIRAKLNEPVTEKITPLEQVAEFYQNYRKKLQQKIENQLERLYGLKDEIKKMAELQSPKDKLSLDSNFFKILDLLPFGVIIHSEGKIIYGNYVAAKSLRAKTKEDLIGVKLSEIIHPDDFLKLQERLLRLIEKKESLPPIVEKFVTFDNNVIEAEVSAFAFDFFEKPAYIAIARDITEENRKKKLLEALNSAGRALLQTLNIDEIFNIVSEKLLEFNISTVLLSMDEKTNKLTVKYKKFNSVKLRFIETLVGKHDSLYKFDVDVIDPKRELRNGKTIYKEIFFEIFEKALEPDLRSLAEKVLNLLNIRADIVSPIIVEEKFKGILVFLSDNIYESDIEAFSLFTQQFALAWRNVELIEKLRQEIKEKNESTKALEKSEKKLRTVMNDAPIAIFIIQGDKPLYLNPYGQKLVGYTNEELTNMNFWDFVHPDFQEKARKIGLAHQRGEKAPERYPIPVVTKNGKTLWFDYSGRVVEVEGEKLVIGTALDITEQKETLEKLKESEERFRTLADTASTAIFVYSGENFVYANKAVYELTGYSEDEMLKLKFWEIVHPDFREMIKQRGLARQRGEKIPNRYEFKIIKKNGEECWVDFTAGKINWKGKAASIGTATDITIRKQLEEELKKLKSNKQ